MTPNEYAHSVRGNTANSIISADIQPHPVSQAQARGHQTSKSKIKFDMFSRKSSEPNSFMHRKNLWRIDEVQVGYSNDQAKKYDLSG